MLTEEVRAIKPVLESKTTQSSSAISRDALAAMDGAPVDSSNRVLRGVACAALTSANSEETRARRPDSSSRSDSKSTIVDRSWSDSVLNSIRENFVSRRKGISKM